MLQELQTGMRSQTGIDMFKWLKIFMPKKKIVKRKYETQVLDEYERTVLIHGKNKKCHTV